MSIGSSSEGRATLARSYRNLSVREIRTRLEGPLGDAERVTAQAELLRRGADDAGPDTTFVTGFAPTSALDFGSVENELPPELVARGGSVDLEVARPTRRVWPVVVVLVLAIAGGVGWALRTGLLRL